MKLCILFEQVWSISLRSAIFVSFFFFHYFQLYTFSIVKFILRLSFERKLLKNLIIDILIPCVSFLFKKLIRLKIITILCRNLMNGVTIVYIFLFFLQFLINIGFVCFLNIIFLLYFFQNAFLISILYHIFYLSFSYHTCCFEISIFLNFKYIFFLYFFDSIFYYSNNCIYIYILKYIF